MPSFLFCVQPKLKMKKLLFYFYFIFFWFIEHPGGGSERGGNTLRAGEYCYECTARGNAKTLLTGSALRCPHGQQ